MDKKSPLAAASRPGKGMDCGRKKVEFEIERVDGTKARSGGCTLSPTFRAWHESEPIDKLLQPPVMGTVQDKCHPSAGPECDQIIES